MANEMNLKPLACTFLFFLGLSGCSFVDVTTHSAPQADFAAYNSFDWIEPLPTDQNDIKKFLKTKELRSLIAYNLKKQGFQINTQSPDFLVGYYTERNDQVIQQHSYETIHSGFSQSRYNYNSSNGTIYSTHVFRFSQGTLVIDFLDAKSKDIFWQALITGVIDEGNLTEQVNTALKKALKQYPSK